MNVFPSSNNSSFGGAEKQRFNVRVFISKYELLMITILLHQFQDWDNTLLYIRKESSDITIMYGVKLKYIYYTKKCYISFYITCFGCEI
jgi:hypothetical protein